MKNLFNNYKIKESKHKIDFSFQELGIEMSKKYAKNIWWIFYKFPESKIRQAFYIMKKEGDYELSHLIQTIKSI